MYIYISNLYICINLCWLSSWAGLEIKTDREGILFVMDRRGRATGEAFVQFESQDDTEQALGRNREKIGHRWVSYSSYLYNKKQQKYFIKSGNQLWTCWNTQGQIEHQLLSIEYTHKMFKKNYLYISQIISISVTDNQISNQSPSIATGLVGLLYS